MHSMCNTTAAELRPAGGTRAALCRAALGLAVLVATASSAAAQDAAVDAVLNRAEVYTPAVPPPVYEPAYDETNGLMSDPGVITEAPARQVEADIDTRGVTTLDFVALVLDRTASDNLYIKVQGQSGSGKFSHVGFYHGVHAGGWTGMTGGAAFFALGTANEFETAHMTVIHDGSGNVTLRLTNIDGGGKVLEYTRGGWTPQNSNSAGFGGFSGNYAIDNWGRGEPFDYTCDNFNRANGGLGASWITAAGAASIVSNAARGDNESLSYYIGACASGIGQEVAADVRLVSTSLDYCALVLNWDGVDNLYVKVQRQAGAGTVFTHVGLYDSVNGGAWSGQTGGPSFFALPAGQQFSTAHMRVTVDGGGTVRLILTEIDGGTGTLEFQRGGWTFRNGNGAGFGGFDNANRFDNWGTGGNICDFFNRANGGLGALWTTNSGTASIIGKEARGDATSRSIFICACGACVDSTAPLVDITAPASFACGCASVTISGSVSDPDGEYDGDVFEIRRSDQNAWTQVGSSSTPRSGTLYTWNTAALTEGYYYVRVTATNECGLSNSDTTLVYVNKAFDTVDLRSPVNSVILGGTVCFDGTVNENNCFDSYTVMYKPVASGSFAPVDPAQPVYNIPVSNDPLASWNTGSGPTAVPDGDYQVRVRGLDDCGFAKEVIRTIKVDNTAPVGIITSPIACASIGTVVNIIGTANDANLSSWVLQYTGGASTGWTTIASGNTPVVNGLLGTWNTTGLPKCAYTLRLIVGDKANVNCSGNNHQTDYYVSVGLGYNRIGDMNCDGVVNFDDINPFVACLQSGGNCVCPP